MLLQLFTTLYSSKNLLQLFTVLSGENIHRFDAKTDDFIVLFDAQSANSIR